MKILVAFSALVVFSLAGCQQTEAPAEPDSPNVAAQAAPASQAQGGGSVARSGATISVDPASLSACDTSMHVATLKWDASKAPGVGTVEIWTAMHGREPKLFARANSIGEKQTGAWVRGGAQFILRDTRGTELSHVQVAKTACH